MDISGNNNHAPHTGTGAITLQPKGVNGGAADAGCLAACPRPRTWFGRAPAQSSDQRPVDVSCAHPAGEDYLRGRTTSIVTFPPIVTTAGNYTLFHVCRWASRWGCSAVFQVQGAGPWPMHVLPPPAAPALSTNMGSKRQAESARLAIACRGACCYRSRAWAGWGPCKRRNQDSRGPPCRHGQARRPALSDGGGRNQNAKCRDFQVYAGLGKQVSHMGSQQQCQLHVGLQHRRRGLLPLGLGHCCRGRHPSRRLANRS
jgi:hypothetical protein